MQKIHLTLEVNKIDKSKIKPITYKDRDGNEVTNKEYRCDVIELNEPKFVAQGNDWRLIKTHFVVQKKDNLDEPSVYVGSGFKFERDETQQQLQTENTQQQAPEENRTSPSEEYPDGINVDDIPF